MQNSVDIDMLLREAARQTPPPSHDLMERVMIDAMMIQAEFLPVKTHTPSLWDRFIDAATGIGERLMRPAYAVPGGMMTAAVLALVIVGAPKGSNEDTTDLIQVALASEIYSKEGTIEIVQPRSDLLAELDEELFPLDEIATELTLLEDIMTEITVGSG